MTPIDVLVELVESNRLSKREREALRRGLDVIQEAFQLTNLNWAVLVSIMGRTRFRKMWNTLERLSSGGLRREGNKVYKWSRIKRPIHGHQASAIIVDDVVDKS